MGFLSTLSQILGVGRKQVNVIVVGLDNSGKTTMLNYLRTPETRTSQIAPTVGYSVTNFTTESFSFTAFDMAGQGKYRNLWETYYLNAQAVIFVVDSADRKFGISGLDLIRGHKWNIHATCALNGAGVQRAIEWLTKEIRAYLDSLK
ncbi:ADP-ribosylation factor family protein [Ostertagia ostertagi]